MISNKDDENDIDDDHDDDGGDDNDGDDDDEDKCISCVSVQGRGWVRKSKQTPLLVRSGHGHCDRDDHGNSNDYDCGDEDDAYFGEIRDRDGPTLGDGNYYDEDDDGD